MSFAGIDIPTLGEIRSIIESVVSGISARLSAIENSARFIPDRIESFVKSQISALADRVETGLARAGDFANIVALEARQAVNDALTSLSEMVSSRMSGAVTAVDNLRADVSRVLDQRLAQVNSRVDAIGAQVRTEVAEASRAVGQVVAEVRAIPEEIENRTILALDTWVQDIANQAADVLRPEENGTT